MTQKISNPKTEVPTGPAMNDRDFINDLVATEKYMTSSYSIAMNEASHAQFYKEIQQIANESQDCQRDLFNMMFKKGWYSFDAAQPDQLKQESSQFSGYKEQLPTTQTH
ncbi:coat F domain-containing protein [Salsuginibacillus halophilus]|uniref:Coat F domain-containing protein n=1 Tax=Salsuginibacillus halophilus TaxID=517424 RepID=A0A2P8HDX1_9BACI|nr:spore coat protein [Salsuginibacillus halophilus]PSL44417.1 coat F domain-containing protein [Salsuginibacillus halophilus]